MKTYTPELREEAVKLVLAQGLTLEEAALRLAIPKGTLGNWVSAARLEPEFIRTCDPRVYVQTECSRFALGRASRDGGSNMHQSKRGYIREGLLREKLEVNHDKR
jgi:transposase-like protein